jgi:hypothetical protein
MVEYDTAESTMPTRKFAIATILAGLALAGCVGDRPHDETLRQGESQNTAGITKDIDATFSTGDTTMNPLRPGSFRD